MVPWVRVSYFREQMWEFFGLKPNLHSAAVFWVAVPFLSHQTGMRHLPAKGGLEEQGGEKYRINESTKVVFVSTISITLP